jgi:cell division septum initiation protein DivIVA
VSVVDDDRLALLPRRVRGYARDGVAALLRDMDVARDQVSAECSDLRGRVRDLSTELDEARSIEQELLDAFVSAQRDSNELRTAARLEAEATLAEARSNGGWRRQLDAAAGEVRSEIARMRSLEDEFRASIRVVLTEALRRLDDKDRGPGLEPLAAVPSEAAGTASRTVAEEASPADVPPAPSLEEDTIDFAPSHVPSAEAAKPSISLRSILLSLAILVVGAAVATTIWLLSGDGTAADEPPPAESVQVAAIEPGSGPPEVVAQASDAASSTTAPGDRSATPPPSPRPAKASLLVRAVAGDSWLEVRAGSRDGKVLFEGFLYRGEGRKFVSRRIWLRVGRGGNLRAVLNGERLRELPHGTADVLVTAAGARTLGLG